MPLEGKLLLLSCLSYIALCFKNANCCLNVELVVAYPESGLSLNSVCDLMGTKAPALNTGFTFSSFTAEVAVLPGFAFMGKVDNILSSVKMRNLSAFPRSVLLQ